MQIAHYTSSEVLYRYLIPTQRLRFGQLENTNDAYEARYDWHLGHMASGSSAEEVDGILAENEKTRDGIRKRVRICCFSRILGNSTGRANNPKLWTNYASGRSGIETGCAVIFDLEKLCRSIEESGIADIIWKGDIAYKNLSSMTDDGSGIDVARCFSIKDNNWRHEKEYRIIAKSKEDIFGPLMVDIHGCVTGIVLNGGELNELKTEYINNLSVVLGGGVKIYRRFYNTVQHRYNVNQYPP